MYDVKIMKFLDLVKKRYSARSYLTRSVPKESIERCLEAARLAPSACNSQPWFFIVVDEHSMKNELGKRAFSGIYSINSFAKGAPVLVVVARVKSSYAVRLGGFLRGINYSLIDIGIACEHFVLQAQEEGIGTCWIGWFNERQVKKMLGLSSREKVDVIISMGYPEKKEAHQKVRKSVEEMRRIIE